MFQTRVLSEISIILFSSALFDPQTQVIVIRCTLHKSIPIIFNLLFPLHSRIRILYNTSRVGKASQGPKSSDLRVNSSGMNILLLLVPKNSGIKSDGTRQADPQSWTLNQNTEYILQVSIVLSMLQCRKRCIFFFFFFNRKSHHTN